MTSGVLAQILMSYEFPPPGVEPSWPWRIVGAAGIIELDPYASVRLGRGDGWELVAEQAAFDPLDASDPVRLRAYARQLEDLVAAIANGREPLVSGDEGRNTTAMLDAAERSAASGTSAAVA
jgi:predicted dehydrogenase